MNLNKKNNLELNTVCDHSLSELVHIETLKFFVQGEPVSIVQKTYKCSICQTSKIEPHENLGECIMSAYKERIRRFNGPKIGVNAVTDDTKKVTVVNDVFVGEVDAKELNAPATGVKHDAGKAALHLLPVEALEELAKVLAYGEKKYNSWNWAQGFKWSRLYGATLRHLYAHMRGENKDPETGLSHLAHAGCNVLFLLYHEHYKLGTDDRHVRPNSTQV